MRLPLLTLCALLPLAGAPVTFNKHVAPILFQYCAPCHRPGESAPFPLLTFKDARSRASQILSVTRRGYMPPWPPEAGYGDFAGARRLSSEQLRTIAAWVEGGAPEGDPAALPAPPRFTEDWQLGRPDVIVQMPQSYRLAADGGDVFRNFIVPIELKKTKYIRAVELHPGNKKIVHHANIVVDRMQSLRRRDGRDGQPGFPGMDVITESGAEFDPDSHFLFWKPGSVPQIEPADMGWRLDPGTDLILNMHLQPSGKAETLQPKIGLYFASRPATRFPMLLQLENDGALNIPPGATDFTVTDRLTLPIDVDALAIYPHAHYLGKRIEAWATLPDGSRRWLIKINDWDINWQAVYEYRRPVSLPKGTEVAMRITYDNSTDNPRNPNDPPKRVRNGDRSQDEMGHVWLQVLPKHNSMEDPRLTLQEAVMRRRLEKYPDDFLAHYSLGALLAFRGRDRESIPYFERALRLQPANPTARNGLAAALLAGDRLDDAIKELRETLHGDPDYASAHYNLARALTAKGDADTATAEYAAYLRQKPDDVDAHVRLGNLLLEQRRYDDALPHLREAARLKPADADIQTNLGALLAIQGDMPGAIAAFELALRIDPSHQIARANLDRARAR